MPAPPDDADVYYSVALIYGGFVCESCGANSFNEPGAGDGDDEFKLLASEALKRGWKVVERDAAEYDWSVRCPLCSSRKEADIA